MTYAARCHSFFFLALNAAWLRACTLSMSRAPRMSYLYPRLTLDAPGWHWAPRKIVKGPDIRMGHFGTGGRTTRRENQRQFSSLRSSVSIGFSALVASLSVSHLNPPARERELVCERGVEEEERGGALERRSDGGHLPQLRLAAAVSQRGQRAPPFAEHLRRIVAQQRKGRTGAQPRPAEAQRQRERSGGSEAREGRGEECCPSAFALVSSERGDRR